MFKRVFANLFLLVLLTVSLSAQFNVRPTESGAALSAEQAAYDVKSYDLDLRVFPEDEMITGALTVKALIVNPIGKFVLDLDTPLTAKKIVLVEGEKLTDLKYVRTDKQILIDFPKVQKKGDTVEVRVYYGGKPRVAPHPPWVGGFMWEQTQEGEPWIATAVQMDGADLWFPCKDQPSDKPDTTSLHFTVPKPLVAASNGKLQSIKENDDGTRTYNWFVSQPISNYAIALNIAPYKLIEDKMQSVAGDTIPISFYILPTDYDKGQELINKTKEYVRFFEEYLGPYPFRADKLGIVQTPHLGMEHQSITAYGNNFNYDENGFDWLMFHELGHEWWANLVTAPDWNDFWIHEGFQSFMDALYAEKKLGRGQFVKSLPFSIRGTKNLKPLAPRESQTTTQMYLLPPDYTQSDGDIYGKGALVLNSLRGLLGDDAFFKSLRRMTYPDPKMEKVTDGKQFRFGTTDDFVRIAEKESGKDLKWFFEVYVRQPKLPKLVTELKGNKLNLRWETPKNMQFPMPVEVEIAGKIVRVEMKNGQGSIAVPQDSKFVVDPNGWLLKEI